ncbi:hypothetical protein LCGC14_1450240 [marine sediment metagenome]|uniref:Uncharacterized protein n=1 Tax=marine sediment metagenome TaxID=412755 RepID=A0A0F9K4C6_9ZZZZ
MIEVESRKANKASFFCPQCRGSWLHGQCLNFPVEGGRRLLCPNPKCSESVVGFVRDEVKQP